jgi:hypothetical protein
MRKSTLTASLLAALTLAAAVPARADNPKPFLRASLQSTKAADAFLAQLGIPLQLAPALEKHFDLEAGTIDPAKPLGLVIVPDRETLHLEDFGHEALVVVLPAVQGKSTAQQLRASGGHEIIDRGEDFSRKGDFSIKRGENHLFLGQGSDHPVGMVDETVFDADYAQSPPLAAVTLNMASLKTNIPALYAQLLRMAPAGTSGRPEDAAKQAQQSQFLQDLQRVSLQIAPQGPDVHFKTWWVPATGQPPAAHPRPTFNVPLALEAHFQLPPGTLRQLFAAVPGDENARREGVGQLVDVLAGADTISIGLSNAEGHPAGLFIVEQFDSDGDVLAQVQAAWESARKQFSSLKPATVDKALGQPAVRLELPAARPDQRPLTLEILQRGRSLYIVAAHTPGGLKGFFDAAPNGTLAAGTVATGTADLALLPAALADLTGEHAPLPGAAFQNQHLQWNSQIASGYVFTDLTVPIATLKNLAGMAGPFLAPAGRGNAPRSGARGNRGSTAP